MLSFLLVSICFEAGVCVFFTPIRARCFACCHVVHVRAPTFGFLAFKTLCSFPFEGLMLGTCTHAGGSLGVLTIRATSWVLHHYFPSRSRLVSSLSDRCFCFLSLSFSFSSSFLSLFGRSSFPTFPNHSGLTYHESILCIPPLPVMTPL